MLNAVGLFVNITGEHCSVQCLSFGVYFGIYVAYSDLAYVLPCNGVSSEWLENVSKHIGHIIPVQ